MANSYLKRLAAERGYQYDGRRDAAHGRENGLDVLVTFVNQAEYVITLGVTVTAEGQKALEEALAVLAAEKGVRSATFDTGCIRVAVKATLRVDRLLNQALDAVIAACTQAGAVNMCRHCMRPGSVSAYSVNDELGQYCEECAGTLADEAAQQAQQSSKGNMALGIVGALIGSLVGVAAWVALGQLGVIAAVAGALIFIGAVKGYEILGRGIGRAGLMICLLIAVVMVFVAENVSVFASVYIADSQAYGQLMPLSWYDGMFGWMWTDSDVRSMMIANLVLGYIFFVGGTIGTLRHRLRKASGKVKVVKLAA